MQAREIRNEARERFALNRYHAMLVYGVVYTLALNIAVLTTVLFLLNRFAVWYGVLLIFLFFLMMAPFGFGMTGFYVRMYRFERVDAFHVFDGFNKYNLERVIIMRLLKFALWLAFTILLIVPGIIFALRTCMSTYILRANPKLKPQDALRASNKIMKGHCWKYFCLVLSFAGWFFMCIATLGLGFIWLAPYYNASKIVFFKRNLQGDKTVYRNPMARAIADNTLGVEEEERARLLAEIAGMEEQMLASQTTQNAQQQQQPQTEAQPAGEPSAEAAVLQPEEVAAAANSEPNAQATTAEDTKADEKSEDAPRAEKTAEQADSTQPEQVAQEGGQESVDKSSEGSDGKPETDANAVDDEKSAVDERPDDERFKIDMRAERERALRSLQAKRAAERKKAEDNASETSKESMPMREHVRPAPGPGMPPVRPFEHAVPQNGSVQEAAVEIGENGESRTVGSRERLERIRAAREQAKRTEGGTRARREIGEDDA